MMTNTPYETLVESAAQVSGVDALDDIDDSHVSAASRLLQQNQLAPESARRALGPECVVPLRYEEAFVSAHCDFGDRNVRRTQDSHQAGKQHTPLGN
jgi:hypothetical protein